MAVCKLCKCNCSAHPSLTVRFHVSCELATLGTGVVAQVTFVRSLARVTSPVDREIAAILEDFATKFTRVTPLALLGDGPSRARPGDVGRAAATSRTTPT